MGVDRGQALADVGDRSFQPGGVLLFRPRRNQRRPAVRRLRRGLSRPAERDFRRLHQSETGKQSAEVVQFGRVAGVSLSGQHLGELPAGRLVVERQRGEDHRTMAIDVEMVCQR